MAAPLGHNYGAKARVWTEAIYRALDRRAEKDKRPRVEILADYAEKLLSACNELEPWAILELGNRMEGKPTQRIEGESTLEIVLRYERDPDMWQTRAPVTIDQRLTQEPEQIQEHMKLVLEGVSDDRQSEVYDQAIETVRRAQERGQGEKPAEEFVTKPDVAPLADGYMANLDLETEEEKAKFEDALAKVQAHNRKVRARAKK